MDSVATSEETNVNESQQDDKEDTDAEEEEYHHVRRKIDLIYGGGNVGLMGLVSKTIRMGVVLSLESVSGGSEQGGQKKAPQVEPTKYFWVYKSNRNEP